jgi:hypothetical protein
MNVTRPPCPHAQAQLSCRGAAGLLPGSPTKEGSQGLERFELAVIKAVLAPGRSEARKVGHCHAREIDLV